MASPWFVDNVMQSAKGTTMPRAHWQSVCQIEIDLPPLAEQQAIGHVLGTLDDKIEVNRRMSETLEAMAEAIFRAWFVDFEPVRAKQEGRWRRGESLPGFPAELYDLFPDRLVDSELGLIPEGWEVTTVGDAVTVLGGTTPSTKEPAYWGGEHAFATPKDLSRLSVPILMSTARSLTDTGVARLPSGLLQPQSVLLSSRAPIGYLALTTTEVTVNQGIIAMTCDGSVGPLYALYWTRANMDEIEMRASGTTFSEINKSTFRGIAFLKPSEAIHEVWDALAASLYARLELLMAESRSLALLRDELLMPLVSGEVRVPVQESA